MHRSALRGVAVALVGLLVIGVFAVQPGPAAADPTVPFTARFSTNANGAIVSLGNNLLTCPASASTCAAARAGSSYDNNAFTMGDLDADDDVSTRNSSMSRLALPTGSSVLWAGLYWGARLNAGTGGQAGGGNYNTMSLRVPGGSGYETITASSASGTQFGPNPSSYNAYQRFADVTSRVQAAGNGQYWGGNVVAATGQDRYAGWSMTVVYTAPGLPLRNLTVFDGFNVVGANAPQSIRVSGFRAPLAGTVDVQLSMIAYEGDLSQTGDYTRLNNTQLATALSPGSNFFDSANGLNGVSVGSRTPADRNMLGFDIKNLGASGAIPNGATSATFTFSSNGDVYYPGVLATSINLYAPDFTASSKTVTNLGGNSPARPGDTLQYTVNHANTGQDPAVDVVAKDGLPTGTSYVPGSLRLVRPDGSSTSLTDGPGDDVGELDGRTVRVRLGTGATSASGGRMACSSSGCTDDGSSRTAYTFQVTLDTSAGGTTVTNIAGLDYRTGTTGLAATYTTNPASVDVVTRADLLITKEMLPDPAAVGAEVTGTITVTNNGPNTALDATMRDPIIDGWSTSSVEAPPGVTCVVDTVIDCDLGDIPNGRSVTIRVHGAMSPGATRTTLTNVAYAATTSYDPDLTNNATSDTIALVREADLAITKSASPVAAPAGAAISYTLSVTNDGPSNAQEVVVTDAVDNASQLSLTEVTATTGGATCGTPQGGSLRCTVATLAAGATATVTVSGVLASGLAAGTVVGNTATVTANTADPDAGDNRATGQVTLTAPRSDVRVTKTGPADVVAGSTIAWTVVATNYGPSDATAVVITDRAPAGVTISGATASRGGCSFTAINVRCPLGRLPAAAPGQPGASATVTIYGTVAPDTPTGPLVNTATVTSATGPARQASATTNVTRSFDLAVTKRANRTSLPADEQPVTYTITVRNNGPSLAENVVVTDRVPLALDFGSATPASGTCDTSQATAPQPDDPDHGLVTCTLADPIPVGGTQTVTVAMASPGDLTDGPDLTETVTVSAPGDDQSRLGNNTATWTLSGLPNSDLELHKTAPATVRAGTVVTYRFDITNHPTVENLIALAPTLEDTLPAGVTLVPAGAEGSVTPDWCTASGQDVTCALPEDIAPEATVTVEFSVRIDPAAADGSTLVNTATVVNRESNPDPAPANNVSQATSTVVAEADVQVAGMAITPRDPAATGPGTWRDVTFTLRNNGPSVARHVQFRTSIDLDASVDASTLPDDCALANGELVCTLDEVDLAPGEEVDVVFGIVLAGYVTSGTYTARAHVSTSTTDTDPDNNDAAATTVVGPARTDLRIGKTAVDTVDNPADEHPAYVAGLPFAYQVTVSVPNDPGTGVADAQAVVLTDPMPDGFRATLVSTTQGTCGVTGGGTGVSCQLGTVAAWPGSAEPVTVTIYGFVDAHAEGEQFENTATATSATPDQDGAPSSVSASAAVDVIERADLRLFKVADAESFNAGGSVGYTLTTVNAGPSDVEHATITDTLPADLTLDPANSPGCTVTGGTPSAGQEVTCEVGAVGIGASVSIRVVATTSPTGTPRTITNTATVTSQAADPIPGNNTASADTRIDRLADPAITSSASTTTPAAGGEITYTGYTINNGPSASWDTTGDTVFPPGFVPVSWDVPFNDCTWNREPPADPASAPWEDFSYVLHCAPADPSAPYPPGASATSVVVMHIPGDTPQGTYTGTSTVTTTTPESNTDNNTTSQQVYVQHVSDTHIVKTLVDPNPMLAGRPATWRLTVTNDGPSIARDVVISDTVPAGMTFSAATVEGGAACPAPEIHDDETIVKCAMGTLDIGESASALVTFDIGEDATGELCNSALVGSGSLDPDSTSNESDACDEVQLPPATDVGITITPARQQHRPGEQAEFTAVVTNNGPDAATAVVATFEVPDRFTGYSGVLISGPDGAQAHCVVGSLICTIGDLKPGTQATYRITGTVDGTPGAELTLTGTSTHGEPDTDATNDTAAATVELVGDGTPPPDNGSPPPGGDTTAPPENNSTPPPSGATPPAGDDSLPLTGADVLSLIGLAALAITTGAIATRFRRRT